MLGNRCVRVVGLAIALAIAGCGSSGDSAKSSTTESTTTTAEVQTTETIEPQGGTSACTDTTGDAGGAAPGADLVSTRLLLNDQALVVTYVMAGDVGAPGEVLWSVTAAPDSDTVLQLGFKVVGANRTVFVFDLNTVEQKNLPPDAAVIEGRTVTVTYPVDEVSGLGDEFKYYALMSVRGNDVDQCPGGVASNLKAQFPN